MSIPKDLLQEQPNLNQEIDKLISPTTENTAENLVQSEENIVESDVDLNTPTIVEEQDTEIKEEPKHTQHCLLYTSPSPRDRTRSRMPSSA